MWFQKNFQRILHQSWKFEGKRKREAHQFLFLLLMLTDIIIRSFIKNFLFFLPKESTKRVCYRFWHFTRKKCRKWCGKLNEDDDDDDDSPCYSSKQLLSQYIPNGETKNEKLFFNFDSYTSRTMC